MKKYVIVVLCFLFIIMTVLPIEANVDSNSEVVEVDLTGISGEPAGPPEVISDNAKIRYGWDLLIYSGDVNVNAWAVPAGVDDESIDVDLFAEDTTLRAVVACMDSAVRIFRSNDNGGTWSEVSEIQFVNDNVTEPHIVHGPDSTYHVFVRYLRDQDQLYTRAYTTYDDASISGTGQYISGSDSVQNYSVCTDRIDHHDYSVYLAYQAGTGLTSSIQLVLTTDQGQNWTAPAQITSGYVGLPNITYGRDILYLSYLVPSTTGNYYARVRRSLNSGTTWSGFVTMESDTFPKMAPQIVAACDNSGDVWAIWPKVDTTGLDTTDWSLRWSWSQDSGVTWTSADWVNSGDSNEYLPSIAVNDYYGSTNNDPYVCHLRATADDSNAYVRTFYWSGGAWTTSTREGEYNASLTRPIVAFNYPLEPCPAFAYVGEGEQNVYFDTWESSGVEEEDVENEKNTCSLDCSIIVETGTLKYNVPNAGHVKVSMFNALGQEVAINQLIIEGE